LYFYSYWRLLEIIYVFIAESDEIDDQI
jgi:hypothetical protein